MTKRRIGKRNNRYRRRLIKRGIVVILIILVLCMISALHNRLMPMVTLKVDKQSILQDEEIPSLQVKASCKGSRKKVLDRKEKYTVQNFVDDLNQGKGYKLKHKIDGTKEGSYPVTIVLDKDVKEKLQDKWSRKIKFQKKDGMFEVKNKYGTWEKNKFKKLDDTYAASEFIVSKGQTYYFDKDGKKVTGWCKIKGFRYYFDKDGMMQTGWKKIKKKSYYLQENGRMAVGWLDIDDKTYYFDKKGKMVTGKQVIGKQKCVFRKDGTLKSRKQKIDPKKPMIALTFDDGPGKYTDTLLNELDKYDARATFFMLGENAKKYPELIEKMEKIGCEIGNHSTTHANLVKLDDNGVKQEIETTQEAVAEAVGYGATVLRPPYGSVDERVKGMANLPVIMWSLDTLDWKKKDAAKITNYVLNYVGDGDIVLMHDIHSFSVESALTLIPQLIERGYQLVTVSELAEARGIEMNNGEKYFHFYKD